MTNDPEPPRQPEEEWLDSLPPDDPRAQASRRDLVRLNAFMGNHRFIARALRHAPPGLIEPNDPHLPVLEIGAGDGRLARSLRHTRYCGIDHGAAAPVPIRFTGLDIAPAPSPSLAGEVDWINTDIMKFDSWADYPVVVANLILHHFTNAQLREWGDRWRDTLRGLIINEPWRHPMALVLFGMGAPFCHPVTRHDAPASIRAGFRAGELPALLGLTDEGSSWKIKETTDLRGVQRMVAYRV